MGYIIKLIATPLGTLLYWLNSVFNNYGLSIILLTIIVKVLLYPLYFKQVKSSAKMSIMQPKIKEIQRKYANDRETQSIKLQELYREEGFNPASGCLPMIVQMPIIFGLYTLFRNPILYISNSDMLFSVHESFLWILDLSQPDKWILPIAAGVATYISTSLSMKAQSDVPGMAGSMKVMKYIFPIMIVLMGRSFPSGLALYWFVGQFMQIFFSLHLNKVRNDMKENSNKKKNKK